MLNRLKLLRKARNLTQEVVSSELGISQQTLSRCETDITTLQIDLLYKISQYYNVSTDYVLGNSDYKNSDEIDLSTFEILYRKTSKNLSDEDKKILEKIEMTCQTK